MSTTTDQDSETSTPPECVGPLRIPPALALALQALAGAARVDDLVPLSVCATELVRRLSRPGVPTRALVICGRLEAVTPLSTDAWDSARSFRDALSEPTAFRRSAAPVELTILVSQDRDRLYVERMTGAADVPTADCWAESYLRLLTNLADRPDAPLAAHPLPAAPPPPTAGGWWLSWGWWVSWGWWLSCGWLKGRAPC